MSGLNLNIDTNILRYKDIPKISDKLPKDKLRKQTNNFEAIILKILLDNALKNEKNIFSDKKDPGNRIYKSMYREELSKASSGSFGFSDLLYNYLSKKV